MSADISEVPDLSPEDMREVMRLEALRVKCEGSLLFFMRWFFKIRQSTKMLVNWHHAYVSEILDDVLESRRRNVIICVPPGSSKTELGVINFIPKGLAQNPWSRFLHVSAQEDLALVNSQTARDIVSSTEYQELWQMRVANDSGATRRWNIMMGEKKAGGVYAAATGGQIIGFRAGYMMPGFSGAILLDDLLKADDAYSTPAKKKANRRLQWINKTRKAHPDIPVVIIMQRLAVDDPVGFVLGRNLPGKWDVINIPALITEDWVKANLPPHIQKMVIVGEKDEKGRFSYWPYKERLEELLELEKGVGEDADGNRINRFMFAAQYMQSPIVLGGNIIKGEKFGRYDEKTLPKMKFRKIFGDTAQKTGERNDFSVFEEWGLGEDGRAYLLDIVRGKWEAPELKRRAIDFWNKCNARNPEEFGQLYQMVIEDKSSGTGLVQDIKSEGRIPIKPMERNKDKLTRVMDVLSYIDAGKAVLPKEAAWVSGFVEECEAFTADDSHQYDDQVDPMVDALIDMLGGSNIFRQYENLI